MNMYVNRISLILCSAISLAGCVSSNTVWLKPGANESDFQRDKNQCAYEATAATQNTDYSYRTVIGQALDQSIRRNDLAVLCMQAKGWSQKVAAEPVKVPVAAKPQGDRLQSEHASGKSDASTPESQLTVGVGKIFDPARVDQLTPGVSTISDAKKLLGPTSSESSFPNGSSLVQWQYISGSKGAHVAILFDPNNKMLRVTHKFVQ